MVPFHGPGLLIGSGHDDRAASDLVYPHRHDARLFGGGSTDQFCSRPWGVVRHGAC